MKCVLDLVNCKKKLDVDRKITVEILRGFNVALAQTFAFA